MINKNMYKIIISLSLVTLCFLNFSGCQSLLLNNTEVVIDIQTDAHDWGYDEEGSYYTCYYSLYSNKKLKETVPFTADKTEVFTAPMDCFNSYIDRKQNKVLNHLRYIELTDEDGNNVEITPIISSIFEETAKLEHDILDMYIIKDGEEYFIFVSFNVNLWTPCKLYYYNQDSYELIELYTFDDEIVTGIKIHSLDSLN